MSAALLAPAFAGAQAADDEYNLTLPGAKSGGSGHSAGGAASQPGGSAAAQQRADAAPGGSSNDGGGLPLGLIALAVVAAGCAGFAAWQLRNRTRDDDATGGHGKVGPRPGEAAGETQ